MIFSSIVFCLALQMPSSGLVHDSSREGGEFKILSLYSSSGDDAAYAKVWVLEESESVQVADGKHLWDTLLQSGAQYTADAHGKLSLIPPKNPFSMLVRFQGETVFLFHQSLVPQELHTSQVKYLFVSVTDSNGKGVPGLVVALDLNMPGVPRSAGNLGSAFTDCHGISFAAVKVRGQLEQSPIIASIKGIWGERYPKVEFGVSSSECLEGKIVLPAFGRLRVFPDGTAYNSLSWNTSVEIQSEWVEDGIVRRGVKRRSSSLWSGFTDIWPVEHGVQLSVRLLGDAGFTIDERSGFQLENKMPVSELHFNAEDKALRLHVQVLGGIYAHEMEYGYWIGGTKRSVYGAFALWNGPTFIFAKNHEARSQAETPIFRVDFPEERMAAEFNLSPEWSGPKMIALNLVPY